MAGQPSLASLREILPGLPSRSSRSERRIQAFDNIDVFLVLGLAEARLRSSGYGGAAFTRFATRNFAGLAQPKLAKRAKAGGARRDRTADLLHAMQALSQLSYGPLDRPTRLGDAPGRTVKHSSRIISSVFVTADVTNDVGDVLVALFLVGNEGRIIVVVVFEGLVDLDIVFRFGHDGLDLAGVLLG